MTADGGKVSGSGYCAAGKKVTPKATANKNFSFVGQDHGEAAGGRQVGFVYLAPKGESAHARCVEVSTVP